MKCYLLGSVLATGVIIAGPLTFHVVGPPPGSPPIPDITVRVVGYGECKSKPNGECTAQISDELKPKAQIIVAVDPPSWVIRNYPGGAVEFPATRVVSIELAPRSDKSLITTARLRQILTKAFLSPAAPNSADDSISQIESLVLAVAREVGLPAEFVKAKLDEFVAQRTGLTSLDKALGDLYHRNFPEAERLLELNVKILKGGLAQDLILLANVRCALGKFDLAQQSVMEALKSDPENPEVVAAAGMFCSSGLFTCPRPAIEYLEDSLARIRSVRPFALELEALVIWRMVGLYTGLDDPPSTKVNHLIEELRNVENKAKNIHLPNALSVNAFLVLSLIRAEAKDAAIEVERIESNPEAQRQLPGLKAALLQEQALVAMVNEEPAQQVVRMFDAASQASPPGFTQMCRAIDLTAIRWGLNERDDTSSPSKNNVYEIDPFIERHLLHSLEFCAGKNANLDPLEVRTRELYGMYYLLQDRNADAVAQFELALVSARKLKIDLDSMAEGLIGYADAIEGLADDEDDDKRELALRRRQFEIAKMSKDGDTISDAGLSLEAVLSRIGDKSGAAKIVKQLEAIHKKHEQ